MNMSSKPSYTHIETGKFLIIIMVIVESVLYFQYRSESGNALILTLVVLNFYQLKMTVSEGKIEARYGIGLIKFTIEPESIEFVEKSKASLLNGIGIRFTKEGMLYSIQSTETVKIKFMKDRKVKTVQLGTDDREGLYDAIVNEFKTA
jgi:hypothetical protein